MSGSAPPKRKRRSIARWSRRSEKTTPTRNQKLSQPKLSLVVPGILTGSRRKHKKRLISKEAPMQIRRFSPDLKTKVPGGHPGLYAVPIQIQNTGFSPERL